MPASEKKRKSDAKWQAKNFDRIGCKLYKGDAAEFRAYAQAHNTTVNALLREYVAECLGRPLERRDGSNEVNASEENPGEDMEN